MDYTLPLQKTRNGESCGVSEITLKAGLRYRRAGQHITESLPASEPASVNLGKIHGITKVPLLPAVDMVVKQVSIKHCKKEGYVFIFRTRTS